VLFRSLLGVSGTRAHLLDTHAGSTGTIWPWLTLAAGLVAAVAAATAVVAAPQWPEMGTKYDAPSGAAPAPQEEPESSLEVWKALDEGRDPTA
jgi:hypothetical protein